MALRCPECGEARLRIEEAMELGADERSDEVALQIVLCAGCGFEAVAVYEESRRGALGEEAFRHNAFPTDERALGEIRSFIATCRDPRNPGCDCRGHQRAREMVRDRTEPVGVDWTRPRPIIFVRD